jgi:hypothetical protein
MSILRYRKKKESFAHRKHLDIIVGSTNVGSVGKGDAINDSRGTRVLVSAGAEISIRLILISTTERHALIEWHFESSRQAYYCSGIYTPHK